MSTWQPIESAPKDGTPVLTFCPDGVERAGYNDFPDQIKKIAVTWWGNPAPSMFAANHADRWISADIQVDISSSDYGVSTLYEFVVIAPTHWMPLPEPPK